MKTYTVSLIQSIEADTEEEALRIFELNLNEGLYQSGSFDVEEE